MRYKARTPEAQRIFASAEATRELFYEEQGEPTPPRRKIKRILHTLSQYAIDNHWRSMIGLGEDGYVCGVFQRASEYYTNWPRRWILIHHTTEHPPRTCRGSRKKKRTRR